MIMIYDKTARKKETNLSINSDLLQIAKDLNINISSTLEKSLEQTVREEKNRRWQEENQDFIEAYNKRVEKNGLFSDEFRKF